MSDREFDIIILGATGYTGRYVLEELTQSIQSTDLKFAIAGRNVQKLQESIDIVQGYLGDVADIRNTPIIKADVQDPASVSDMCKRAKLILNCVGPYKFYGEFVVSACIENGTHHVDISGELPYLETIQAKYFNTAKEKEIYIAQACGFDCIPADFGISLLRKEFGGDLSSVEYFVEIGRPSGGSLNIGTYASAVNSVGDTLNARKYDRLLKEEVFKKEIVQSKYPLHKRFPPLFYSSEVEGWCLWFIGPDERIIKRSQQFRHEYMNERPVQSEGYIRMSSFCWGLCYMFLGGVFGSMALCSGGRKLLIKHPSFFTVGAFSSTGPTRKQVLDCTTKLTLIGKGWSEKLEPTDEHPDRPNKRMKLTISAPEPAYAFTSMCMVNAGLIILQEKERLPLKGGVLTPGVAFEHTSLRERLEKRGVKFEFEEIK